MKISVTKQEKLSLGQRHKKVVISEGLRITAILVCGEDLFTTMIPMPLYTRHHSR